MTDLQGLALRCFRAAQKLTLELKAKGALSRQVLVVSRWNFPEFKYGANGPELGSGSVVAQELPDWSKAAEDVLAMVKTTDDYRQVISSLREAKKDLAEPEAAFDQTLRQFVDRFLEKNDHSERFIEEWAEVFERRTLGLPIEHQANFRLVGLLVKGQSIAIDAKGVSIKIRPTTRDDVETSFGGPYQPFPFMGLPDSIAEVRLVGRPFTDAQSQQGRVVSILRLYTDSPVSVNGAELFFDTVSGSAGMSWGPTQVFTWRKAKLGEEDRAHLGSFWDQVVDKLPPTFGQPTEMAGDAVLVAFARFNEALDSGGSFEKLVTNAVMGLEALYFKPTGEQAELTYRLSMRVAAFLTHLGRDPAQTREIVDLAYDVRSDYVHGGQASQKDKRKIERLYGNLRSFQFSLLDLLRRSIVALLFIRKDKEALIDLLDDSLIIAEKGKELQGLLSGLKPLLTPLQSAD